MRQIIRMTLCSLAVLGLSLAGCGGDDPPIDCEPNTCQEGQCGQRPDGCGGTLECPGCPTGQECIAGNCQPVQAGDTCADIEPCVTPPAAECDGNTLVTYASPGTCEMFSGFPMCVYPPTSHPCGDLVCDAGEGACVADPGLTCNDIQCVSPPSAQCQDNTLVTYASPGTCRETAAGPVCDYDETRLDCGEGHTCDVGTETCVPTAGPSCTDVECITPPATKCQGNTLVTYSSPGTCRVTAAGPVCDYDETRQDCGEGYLCNVSAEECEPTQGLTCADIECTNPLPATCQNNTLVTYASPGTCTETESGPVCDYTSSEQDCGNDVCDAAAAACVPAVITCDFDSFQTLGGAGEKDAGGIGYYAWTATVSPLDFMMIEWYHGNGTTVFDGPGTYPIEAGSNWASCGLCVTISKTDNTGNLSKFFFATEGQVVVTEVGGNGEAFSGRLENVRLVEWNPSEGVDSAVAGGQSWCLEDHEWSVDYLVDYTANPPGDPCGSHVECAGYYAFCYPEDLSGWEDGYCFQECVDNDDCVAGVCDDGLCWASCATDGDCRDGYGCDSFDTCYPFADGQGLPGDACTNHRDCEGGFLGFCWTHMLGFPEGYCVSACDTDADCGVGGVCETFDGGGKYCLASCDVHSDCRPGYYCDEYDTCWPLDIDLLIDESLRDGQLPQGWTESHVSFTTTDGGYAYITNVNGYIQTPAMNLSTFDAVYLVFDVAKFGTGDDGPITVQVSNDNGSTWTAQTFDSPTPGTYTVDGFVTSGPTLIEAAGTQVIIRFTRPNSPSQKRIRDVVLLGFK